MIDKFPEKNFQEEKLVHHAGRSGNFKIAEGEKIAEGAGGEVKSIEMNHDNKNRKFVIKEFFNTEGNGAQKSFEKYLRLKEVGLKNILSTYRKVERKNSVVMTDLGINNNVAISINPTMERVPKHEININYITPGAIKHILSLMESDLVEASRNGIYLNNDSYLLVLPRNLKGGVDFDVANLFQLKIVDLENIDINCKFDSNTLLEKNIQGFVEAIDDILYTLIPGPFNKEITTPIHQWEEDFKAKVGLQNKL